MKKYRSTIQQSEIPVQAQVEEGRMRLLWYNKAVTTTMMFCWPRAHMDKHLISCAIIVIDVVITHQVIQNLQQELV